MPEWQFGLHVAQFVHGQFSSLHGTTTLRLKPEFPYPPGEPRSERLVFDANDQLIVPLNEWYYLMKGSGAVRTRGTYLAALRPWFGFLAKGDGAGCIRFPG